jgi:putative addiction module killer protein
MKEIRETETFKTWFSDLQDARAQYRILTRIKRLSEGNPGDVKPIGEGISEMRIGDRAFTKFGGIAWDQLKLLCGIWQSI